MHNKSDDFFFESVQVYMKDAECSATNEKSDLRFLFFKLRSFVYSKYGHFSKNFHDNSKKKNRIFFSFFHSFLNYLKQKFKTALFEGKGVCMSLTRKSPKEDCTHKLYPSERC